MTIKHNSCMGEHMQLKHINTINSILDCMGEHMQSTIFLIRLNYTNLQRLRIELYLSMLAEFQRRWRIKLLLVLLLQVEISSKN